MSKRESISRYNLIIKKVRKSPSTFEDIADYLALESELQEYNFNISKRTFQRDLNDIRSLFNIDIVYDFSNKIYRIEDDQQEDANERIMEAFDTFNALNISDRLSNYIHFEKRIPKGTENLNGILHAIRNTKIIQFQYQKFGKELAQLRSTEPYALKEFNNRWYLIAKDLKDNKIKTFGLDRLSELDITRKTFYYPEKFNVFDTFKFCFGIISSDNKNPETIVLSFSAWQGKYIKTLPLHHTQKIISDNKEELIVQLKVHTTYDLVMEILSFGQEVKVLQPESLVQEVKQILKKSLKNYR